MDAQRLFPFSGPIRALRARCRAARCAGLLYLLALGWLPAQAQTLPPCGEQPAVRAVAVVEQGRKSPAAYLNDRVAVDLCHIDALLKLAVDGSGGLRLYINGVDAGLPPVAVDRDAQRLLFTLRRTSDNLTLWRPVLHNPLLERRTKLQLSVGIVGGEPLAGVDASALTLPFKKLWVDGWTYASGAALLLLLVLTVYLGQRSDMLRDSPSTEGEPRPTYSLARVQMAWWFVLVVAGFMAILLVTGDTDSLPASILALTGISALTGVAAMAVSPSAGQRLAARQSELAMHKAATDTAIAAVAEVRASQEAVRQQLAAAQASAQDSTSLTALAASLQLVLAAREREASQLAARPPPVEAVAVTQGFFKDLVSDERGRVALDRLQMVVWSVLLGGLYLHSVLVYVTMPDFSATLLGLMGLSSGTYVGFKMPSRGTAA